MLDIRTSPEAPPPPHVAIRREDYRPPDWLGPEIGLRFTLGIENTRVQAKLSVERNPQGQADAKVIRLNGDELKPIGVWVDGVVSDNWTMEGSDLLIPVPGDAHEIGIENEVNPAANTKLMGLYG